MENGLKQAKSTGYIPPIKKEGENGSAPVEYTAKKKASLALTNAHMKGAKRSFTGEVLGSELLAIQILMSDFKALKIEAPRSWQASSNGKIYWCAEFADHSLKIENGELLVDDIPASEILEKLLAK